MLTASLVLFHNPAEKLREVLESFLAIPGKKHLYAVDNSKNRNLETLFSGYDEVTYLWTGENLGFGKGHNYVLHRLGQNSLYHLILNPDIYFEPEEPRKLQAYLETHPKVGVVGPQINYPDGRLQHSIRRFPRLLDFAIRRVPGLIKVFRKRYHRTHYLDRDLSVPQEVDSLLGCFQLFRTSVFQQIGGFDKRYFMYLEDIDICREVLSSGYQVVYYPAARIFHHYEKASSKSAKLFLAHLKSIRLFLFKWWGRKSRV